MPLTLTITEGVLPKGQEKIAFTKLSELMLKYHGATGNKLMTENVVGTIHVLPKEQTFTGMKATSAVFIEWKVPAFGFANREIQLGYFREATDIIHDLSGGKQPKDKIFINVMHAVDGAWNLNGKAVTNEEFGAALAESAKTTAA